MHEVGLYRPVRQAYFRNGKSTREISRTFGLHRDTIRKMLQYSAPPGYRRKEVPRKPKLDPFTGVIDAILSDDKNRPRKQRHTAKRIFDRIRDEYGYSGGYTIVKDYVRKVRLRSREMFVPLTSYTATFGEDSDYTINPPSYTDSGNGTITDKRNRAYVAKCSVGQTNDTSCSGTASGTYDATNNSGSTDVCGSLTLASYSDWRLPNMKELGSIADYAISSPAINTVFTGTQSAPYLSSTTFKNGTLGAWAFYYHGGYTGNHTKLNSDYARCVR